MSDFKHAPKCRPAATGPDRCSELDPRLSCEFYNQGYQAGLAEGAKRERADVVAWLRNPNDAGVMVANIYRIAADIIQREDHLGAAAKADKP
jgi:hypothetical protein